jgi:hypothetical protein
VQALASLSLAARAVPAQPSGPHQPVSHCHANPWLPPAALHSACPAQLSMMWLHTCVQVNTTLYHIFMSRLNAVRTVHCPIIAKSSINFRSGPRTKLQDGCSTLAR